MASAASGPLHFHELSGPGSEEAGTSHAGSGVPEIHSLGVDGTEGIV